MGTNPTNPSLTIKSITLDDDANYRCQATNIAGERASNEARLLVTGGKYQLIFYVLALLFCVIKYTFKPVLRGHLWDKEKVIF